MPDSNMTNELVLIFDFGSQFGQLIARRVREQNVFCMVVRHDIPADRVKALNPKGIIFSGGAHTREYGRATLTVTDPNTLFRGYPTESTVWMSHGDQVQSVSGDFVPLA